MELLSILKGYILSYGKMFFSLSPVHVHPLAVSTMYRVQQVELSLLHTHFPGDEELLVCPVELGMSEREDCCSKGHAKDINRPIQLLIPQLQGTDTGRTLQRKFL